MRKPIISVFVVLLSVLLFPVKTEAERLVYKWFTDGGEALSNPYMGYMVWADGISAEHGWVPDASLAFALLYWDEFEPEKGVYDFEAFEKRNNIEYLQSLNIRLVIRVVSDYPTADGPRINIPAWLYEETGGAGEYYENAWVSGFAPDYTNGYIIERHALMIAALAQRYDDPQIVAFVQLGSLGHWGEWHNTMTQTAYFPNEDITDIYIKHYRQAFRHVKLQTRRPYTAAPDTGLYNDMTGHAEATALWLDWISVAGMDDFYLNAPSGGEFATTYPSDRYFGDMYDVVKLMVASAHTTYLSCVPPTEGDAGDNASDLLRTMGYRFLAVRAVYDSYVHADEDIFVRLTLRNAGIAPFYYDWPFYLFLTDGDGVAAARESPIKASDIVPGAVVSGETWLSVNLPPGVYTLKLGLVNPFTGLAEARMANAETDGDGLLVIGDITIYRD